MPDPRTLQTRSNVSGKYRLRRALLQSTGAVLRRSQPERAAPGSSEAERGPRILLIRPDHLGDVLLATPAFAALRAALPHAHLTALVGPWAEIVARRNPHVDAVLTLPFPGFTRQPPSAGVAVQPYRLAWREAQRLQAYHFDAAIVMRVDHWWGGLLVALARIPQRLGYSHPDVAPFLTRALPVAPDTHVTVLNLALVDSFVRTLQPLTFNLQPGVPPLEFPVTDAERAAAVEWLRAQGIGDEERLIAIHPGAGAAVKLWTNGGWATVADALADAGARIVLTGSKAEAHLTADVAARMQRPVLDAAGATDFGTLAALLARCALVVGADAGALHLATAVGTPTVRLYGPIDPRQFGPWGPPAVHRVVLAEPPLACQFCERLDYPDAELPLHPCVRWIRVEQVIDAARDVLALTRA